MRPALLMRRPRRPRRHDPDSNNSPIPWSSDPDGRTCWFADEDCPDCGGMQATNGREVWCLTCDHFQEE
jgi:hypothetical protein